MAKAGKQGLDRCFHGTIKRETDDENGNPVVYGAIKLNDGNIFAMAPDQWILVDMLDELVQLVLDYAIHKISGHDFIVSSN